MTVGTHINVEDEDDGKNEFIVNQNVQPSFPEMLSHNIHDDIRSLTSSKSYLEDESKSRFNLKTSSSIDNVKCEYIY